MSFEWDEEEIFPLDVIKKAGRAGLPGSYLSRGIRRIGLGYIEYSIIVEELSRVDPSVGLIVAAHNSLCTNHIFVAGSDEQRRKYIPKLATGEWIGSWSLTESESGSDAGGMRTKAVKDGSCWVLNGSKVFTTNAGYADICVAMAVSERAASHHGVSAFILEKGIPGFQFGKKENKLGMRASATGEVISYRLPRAGIATARQARRGIRRQPSNSGWRPHLHRGAVGWHGAGRIRGGSEVFQAAQTIRTAHLGVSIHPEQARGHGHRNRRRAPAYLSRRAG